MINKIKDFLKSKRARADKANSSSQEEELSSNLNDESDAPVQKLSLKERLTNRFGKNKSKIRDLHTREWKLPDGIKTKASKTGSSLLSPSLTRSIEKFLSREAREPIHQVMMVVIICGITYTMGKITALVLRGAPTISSSRDYTVSINLENDFTVGKISQIKGINIFRTNSAATGGKKKVADTKCESSQQTSALPIKLVNTVVLQDTVKSLASVQVRGGRNLQEVRIGDDIDNLAKIFKITRLEILIKNLESGICETIANDKARAAQTPISVMSPSQSRNFKMNKKMNGIDNVGNKFSISRALLDEKMKDIASILTQARAVKIQNPDGSLSFKMTEMDPQGLFPYLGLQDQDIITSINGKPIYDMNEVMSLFAKIKNLDNLQLGVKREGTDSTQEYSIKK